jgi:zinc transport system permease protein
LFALLGAIVSGVGGLMVSFYIGSSTGSCITLLLAMYFFLTLAFRKRRL